MEHVNTFKGLNRDDAIENYPLGAYYDANNIRISENKELSDGNATNPDGNYLNYTIPDCFGTTKIIGECKIRNKLILFVLNTIGDNFILSFNEDDNENDSPTIIYHDLNVSSMGFSEDYPIIAVGRYESTNVQKIYWMDNNYKSLRSMNIMEDNLTAKQPVYFDITPSITFSVPTVTAISSGGLRAGVIQYAYQLFRDEGPESNFSSPSKLIHLSNASETATTDKAYKGAERNTEVGKSVTLSITDLDTTNYDRIRLVSIFYELLTGEPEINVIYEGTFSSDMILTDGGTNSLGTYTLEEFRIFESTLFTGKTLSVKNDILFVGNTKENNFDVDYDARAYRFELSSTSGRVYQSDNSYYVINGSVGSWTKFTSSGGFVTQGTNWGLPEDMDGINSYNKKKTYDMKYGYKVNSTIMGGSGLNISYEFKIYSSAIDSKTSKEYYAAPKATNSLYSTLPNGETNFSYASSASPIQVRGFTRDEIYRFGIIFYDSRGHSSFVKWIGDIRMPKNEDVNGTETYKASLLSCFYNTTQYDFRHVAYLFDGVDGSSNIVLNANHLYPQFTVMNIPTDDDGNTCSWQIVYVKRDDNDKTVLAQGIWGGIDATTDSANDNDNMKPRSLLFEGTGGKGYVQNIATYNQFISPEVNFGKLTTSIAGDYIIPVGYLTSGGTYPDLESIGSSVTDSSNVDCAGEEDSGGIISTVYKYTGINVLSKRRSQTDYPVYTWNNGSILTFTVQEGKILCPNEAWVGSVSEKTYENRTQTAFEYGEAGRLWGYGGTALFLKTKTGPATKHVTHWGMTGTEILVVNYKRELPGQYGGDSYSARQYNEYIPCSPLYNGNTSIGKADSGDTYICYFDHLKTMYNYNLDASTGYDSHQETILIPVETTINLTLRHDQHVNKLGYKNAVRLNETNTTGADFETTGLLYQYNDVYSKVNDSTVFYHKPSDWESEENFDTRIKYSDIKINRDTIDGWTKFRSGNFKDVENQYGAITKLDIYNNQLVYFQEKAFGILAVNEREILASSNIGSLTLGTGGVLDRFDYISTLIGTLHQWSVLITLFGMFWYDYYNNEFYKYTQGSAPEPLFTTKKLKSYVKDKTFNSTDLPINSQGVITSYDSEHKEVLFTSLNGVANSNNFTVGYSCMKNVFTSFYDFEPIKYIDFNRRLHSVATSKKGDIYRHNAGTSKVEYYGTVYPSDITVIVNPYPGINKIFDVVEYDSEFKKDSTYYHDATFTSLQLWNSYQDTGVMTLTPDSNIRRKWRKWRINTLRDTLEGGGKKPRMRDTHLFIKFSFTNVLDPNQREFKLKPVITKYNVVPR